MARTRWPPDWEPWPLAQARQHRNGTAGGCQKNLGPADRSFRKTTSGVSRLAGQAGPRPPTLRPHHAKPAEAGPEAHIHILPAEYERWEIAVAARAWVRRSSDYGRRGRGLRRRPRRCELSGHHWLLPFCCQSRLALRVPRGRGGHYGGGWQGVAGIWPGSRLPDPGGQQDHRYCKWQHVQDNDDPGGYLLLSDFQADEEQDRQPARNASAPPEGKPHEGRRGEDADEIHVNERMAEPGSKDGHQEPRGCAWWHVCRRGGGEVRKDQDVDDGSAEGTDSPDQRGDGGDCRNVISDQRGDRSIRDGQGPEPEKCERACDVDLSRVLRRNCQHLERGRSGLYHLVGAFGTECLGTYIQHRRDREEKGQHPLTCPGRVIHSLLLSARGRSSAWLCAWVAAG